MNKYFLTILVIIAACRPTTKAPDDLITEEKMADLLTEIHLLEAKINQLQVKPYDSKQYVYDHYEKLLFDDFGVTGEQYERSLTFYLDHPDLFERVYEAVVDTLMQREKIGNVDYRK